MALNSMPPARVVRSALVGLAGIILVGLAWHSLGTVRLTPIVLTPARLAFALAGVVAFLAFRGWRYHLMLPHRPAGLVDLIAVTGTAWGIGLLVPGPSADAAFVGLARREYGVGVIRATGISIAGRLLDLLSLGVVVVLAALMSTADEPVEVVFLALALGIAFPVGVAVMASARCRPVALWAMCHLPVFRERRRELEAGLDEFGGGGHMAGLLISTALCRCATAMEYAAIFAMVGLHLGFWGTWFVLGTRTFLSAIPIQGLGGVGTSQAWWTAALRLEDVPLPIAISASVTLHVVDMALSLPVALVAWLWLRRSSARHRQCDVGAEPDLIGRRVEHEAVSTPQ